MTKFNKIAAEIPGLYIKAMQITAPEMGQVDFTPIEHGIIARALTGCPEYMQPELLNRLKEIERRNRTW
jgi:hypothetical protein